MKYSESRVKSVEKQAIVLETEGKIPFGMCVWITGNKPNALVSSLKNKHKGNLEVFKFY